MTKKLYLQDTYQFSSHAKIVNVHYTEKGVDIILDQTIFYPQGGGQPFDTGEIRYKNGVFTVTEVRLDDKGIVHHYGYYHKKEPHVGENVICKISEEKRIQNAKLHSAGHIIAAAIEKTSNIIPIKGHHFLGESYVQCNGIIENIDLFNNQLQEKITEILLKNIPIISKTLSLKEAQKMSIQAPPGKEIRYVEIQNISGCGCGGTHVKNTGEIEKIIIENIKCKKGKTKISYRIKNN